MINEEQIQAFVAKLQRETNEAAVRWIEEYSAERTRSTPVYTVSFGRKYARVIMDGRSAWGFIDEEGNILKAKSWSRPHPKPRGHVNTATYGVNYTWAGPAYLR